MSLHKFAEQVAANGRGDDSLLVHMTPDEVSRLQAFAQANGRSLTINPHTGLPEAGMLSDLFKAVAPIALGAFLGPAGMGLQFGGLSSALSAGIATGGITALATGSLSRGLMAGLGAYGGAGLGEGLANAGLQAEVTAGMPSVPTGGLTPDQVQGYADQVKAVRTEVMDKFKDMSMGDKLSSGLGAIKEAPMNFLSKNAMPLAAAAAPIMAGAMVPTTTKLPENTNPAYIRQKLYDPYTQTYKSLAPVKASEWGSRSFSDAYTNPQTGEMATLQPRSPGMAGGGIVALADGGLSAGMQYAATHGVDIQKMVDDAIEKTPFATSADIKNMLAASGLTQEDVNPYLTASTKISDAQRYALSHADEMPGAGGLAGMQQNIMKAFAAPDLTQAQIDAKQDLYKLSDADIQSPLSHGYQVADTDVAAATNYLKNNADVQAWISSAEGRDYIKQHPEFDANDIAYTHYKRYGEAEGRKWGIPTTVVTPPPSTAVIPGDTKLDTATTYDNGAFGNYGSGPATGVDYKDNTVSIATPGDIITNPDQTRTVTPNIPGRPYGGFTGIDQLKSAYTAGGGSLGYTAPVPRTIEDFNQLYNQQTGDSLAAYNYLMGKGANNNAYPVQSQAATSSTGIQRPYWSSGVKYKPRYLSYDKEGNIVSSATSGKSSDTTNASDLIKAKTIEVIDSSGNDTQTYTAVLQDDGTYLAGNGKRYDVTGKELAADGGMMGYAMGGGLGSLGAYSDGGRLLKGPGDGVSDSIPATIGSKQQPARLADGEFVVPARIVSELGNGSTDAGAKKLYAMMDRVQKARGKTTGKNKVAANSRADKYLPA